MIPPAAVIVSGVSGSGKTTIGERVAGRLGWRFVDADDIHPAANRRKMAAGTPLDDLDRKPWLIAIGRLAEQGSEQGIVIACSALRRSYRDLVRASGAPLFFVQLHGDPGVLRRRLDQRLGHFMPASLLGSQLETLEALDEDETGMTVSIDETPGEITDRIVRRLDTAG